MAGFVWSKKPVSRVRKGEMLRNLGVAAEDAKQAEGGGTLLKYTKESHGPVTTTVVPRGKTVEVQAFSLF